MELLFAKYDSFLGHTSGAWTAWLTLVLALGAAVTAVIAVRQLCAINEQLNAAEKQRKTSILPVVLVPRVFLLTPGDAPNTRMIELKIHNYGLAAARDIEIHAWAYEAPSDIKANWRQMQAEFMTACLQRAATEEPWLVATLEALAANSFDRVYLRSVDTNAALSGFDSLAAVIMTGTYVDLDGDKHYYPRRAKAGKIGQLHRWARSVPRQPERPDD